ncbi:hypothetical protein AGMMS50239_27010 [Bacteroidia bacterium]|nr:hypothetical protein AGMMS50239_27010 [Bacteroidia bacterium]
MKKFIIIMLSILPFVTVKTMAQYLPGGQTDQAPGKKADLKPSIEGALKSSLFIIQQNYQLKDVTTKKGKYFGKDGKANFGTIYTFGIKTSGGFYSNTKITLPWLYDSNFEEYKRKTQYSPVISETKYKEWGAAEYLKLKFSSEQAATASDSLVFVTNKAFNNKGLNPDVAAGKKKGWLVWIILENKEKPDAFSFEVVSVEQNLDASPSEITAASPSGKTVEGGLFLTERTTDVGQIALELSGLVFKKDSKWFVKKPVNEGQQQKSGRKGRNASKKSETTVNPSNQDGLTPASSTGSKRSRRGK